MNVGMGGIDKDMIELPQSVVCCTLRFTDMVLVVQFRIKGKIKVKVSRDRPRWPKGFRVG